MPDPIPADDLLARTLRTYAALESYSDHGELTSRIESSDPGQPKQTRRTRFATRWKRPDSLRFEFREMTVGPEDESKKYVIWSRAGVVRTWWTVRPKVEVARDLERALARATGVSGGLAAFIPNLARGLASQAGFPTAPVGFLGKECQLDGARCVCIGMRTGDRDEWIWIEAESALVLRHDDRSSSTKDQRERMHRDILAELDSEEALRDLDPEDRARLRESSLSALREGFEQDLTFWHSARYFPIANPDLDDGEFEFTPPSA
jgi:hypothetical protein